MDRGIRILVPTPSSSWAHDPVKERMGLSSSQCPFGCENVIEALRTLLPLCTVWSNIEMKCQVFSSPVQNEVWSEDELAGVVERAPHQPHHEHLHPATLQEPDLVQQAELHEAWANESPLNTPPSPSATHFYKKRVASWSMPRKPKQQEGFNQRFKEGIT